jgi:hypothetical protein
MPLAFLLRGAHHALHDIFFCADTIAMSSGYSQSALLLAHNQITAPQFIRRSLHSS